MTTNYVILGRGQNADVRLADISISRKHTIFRLTKKNEIYIADEGSKFGTLVLQQAPLILKKGNYTIQNGRTQADINVKLLSNY